MSNFNRYYAPSSSSYGERSSRFASRTPFRAQRAANVDPAKWESFKAAQPERAAWIDAKAASFDFAASMRLAVLRFGDLTENQGAAIDRCMARDADRAQQAAQPRQTVSPELAGIRAAFDAVVAGGARKAQITIEDVNLSLAPLTGRNPGAIYVKVGGAYAGKIVGTTFTPGRDAPADLGAKLAEIDADPTGAVRAQAARTAQRLAEAALRGERLSLPCGCCGITLTDPVSVARGIGPICAGKWGF